MTDLKLKSKVNKLIKLSDKLNNNEYSIIQLTNFLILLNLKVEILLFKKMKKNLFKKKIIEELINFENNLNNLILSQKFLKKKITKKLFLKKRNSIKYYLINYGHYTVLKSIKMIEFKDILKELKLII